MKLPPENTSASDFLKQWCIGLTGGIATGKSTVATMLRQRGHTVIDADVLAREVVAHDSPTLKEIVAQFGPSMLDSRGGVDRKAMRDLIFGDPEAKKSLERIMHPAIRKRLISETQRLGLVTNPRIFFYEAALIHETGSGGQFREVWAVTCPRDIQIARLMKGRGLPLELAEKLLAGQMPVAQKVAMSTRVIDASGSLAEVEQQIDQLLARLNF